jgi:hypothetical protein
MIFIIILKNLSIININFHLLDYFHYKKIQSSFLIINISDQYQLIYHYYIYYYYIYWILIIIYNLKYNHNIYNLQYLIILLNHKF